MLKVIYTSDCIFEVWDKHREMPICPQCLTEYQDCKCPGPGQDDIYDYEEIDGVLYATPICSE